MELWIRSQDKTTLIKSYEIYIAEYGEGSYVIRAKRSSHILGTYNSFERALEVLDEIQNKLKNEDNDLINKLKILEKTPIINCSNNDECEININIELLKNMIIYEMPEK